MFHINQIMQELMTSKKWMILQTYKDHPKSDDQNHLIMDDIEEVQNSSKK